MRFNPPAVQFGSQLATAEARDTDHSTFASRRIERSSRHAGHRRAHLAADTEKQNVAVVCGQRFRERGIWLAEQGFECVDGLRSGDHGRGCGMRDARCGMNAFADLSYHSSMSPYLEQLTIRIAEGVGQLSDEVRARHT